MYIVNLCFYYRFTCLGFLKLKRIHNVLTFLLLVYLFPGAAGNFLCSLEDMSFNAFKTVQEIDIFGTYNVSKVAFDKYLKVIMSLDTEYDILCTYNNYSNVAFNRYLKTIICNFFNNKKKAKSIISFSCFFLVFVLFYCFFVLFFFFRGIGIWIIKAN